MNAEEQIAENYLQSLGLGNVRFEPDGNIPPDFSVGSSIGVEVRQLNQNYFGEDGSKGLEELSIPLWKILEKVISEFDDQFDGNSYWIIAKYHRPSKQSSKETAKSVRDSLEDFLRRGSKAPDDLIVNNHLNLMIRPATSVLGQVFRLGGMKDRDNGGWVLPIYAKIYCIVSEKSR